MKMLKTILAAACIFALPFAAHADGLSGNEWVARCNAPSDSAWRVACTAYVRGLADGLILRSVEPGARACISPKVLANQLRDIGLRFMASNPKDRHLDAGVLLTIAFQEAWPCKPERTDFK